MALQSMTAIATATLQASAPSVAFSGIPSVYRDLILVISGTASTGTIVNVFLNNDNVNQNGNYSRVYAVGDGASTASVTQAQNAWAELSTAQSQTTLQIIDYSSTNKHKTVLSTLNLPGAFTLMLAGRWANTAVVNNVQVTANSGTISTGTTISLYGRIA